MRTLTKYLADGAVKSVAASALEKLSRYGISFPVPVLALLTVNLEDARLTIIGCCKAVSRLVGMLESHDSSAAGIILQLIQHGMVPFSILVFLIYRYSRRGSSYNC